MNILNQVKQEITTYLQQNLGAKFKVDQSQLELPPDPSWGDFAFPCQSLAKVLKKSPNDIAQGLQEVLSSQLGVQQSKTIIRKVESKGPYLNFFIDKAWLAKNIIPEIIKKREKFAENNLGKGKKIMVEYVSPNTNKPLHLGHIRNAALGWSLVQILEKTGHKVIKAIYVNDRGIHICKSMLAYQKWGPEPEDKGMKGDFLVGKYYVMFDKKLKEDPKLLEEAQEMLIKWEAGDKKVLALWKKMNKMVLLGHKETYKKLKVDFDKEYLESDLYKHGKGVVKEGQEKEVFVEKDGAVTVELEKYDLPNKVIQRSDGTAVYITTDLYLSIKKVKDCKIDSCVFVIGSEQELYLKQLFKTLELLGYEWASDWHHLNYGMVELPEGRMKSREGTVVDADDLINELEEMAKKELAERYKDLNKRELLKRANQIALGAIKYYLLQVDPRTKIVFNPKESLSFTGRTGPYLQYTQARINSILKKTRMSNVAKLDYAKLQESEEQNLILLLAQYPDMVEKAASTYDSSGLAKYLYDLAAEFNNFYHKHQVLKAEKDLQKARLALIQAVQIVVKDGLELLGIEAPEVM